MLKPVERRPSKSLLECLERLSYFVAEDVPGREREWAEAVEGGLYRVGTALEQHIASTKAPEGPFAEVDETRPTLGRQAEELRTDHEELLKEVESLRQLMQHVAQSFQSDAIPQKRNVRTKIPDFQALR